jgi:hypothetical protein
MNECACGDPDPKFEYDGEKQCAKCWMTGVKAREAKWQAEETGS